MAADDRELSKALATLREQLALAQTEGDGHDLRFLIDEIEVELNLALTTEGKGEIGAKFLWVVTASMDAKLSQVATQKIKLKMKLVDKDGNSTMVSNKGKK